MASNDATRKVVETNGKSSELLRATEMRDFSLGHGRVDVRGWPVYSSDAELIGWVDSLLVDMHTKAVRYLGIALDKSRPSTGARTVLVPVGSASRSDDRRVVTLNSLSSAQLASAPRVPDRPVTRTDENAALRVYGMPTWRDVPARALYDGPNFEERRLFGEPGTRA